MTAHIPKYLLLLFATAAGGVGSSFMWLYPNGVMAGCMAFCFSLGTIWLAEKERRRPGSVEQAHALVAGLITGLVASIPLMMLETTRKVPSHSELAMLYAPPLESWYLIAAPVLYGMALHWSYHQRHKSNKPLRSVLWRAVLLTAVIRLGLEAARSSQMPGRPSDLLLALFPMTLFFLVFISPFPILWVLLTSALDPARGKVGTLEAATIHFLEPEIHSEPRPRV